MSQYLSFKLVNKTNPDIKIDLGYWCTSIARGISYNFQNIFRYTEDGVKLDYDTLESYIETLHEGIDEYKESLRREQERKRDNIDLLLKAQSEVVVNAIKEDINDNDESIVEWQDEIDTWQSVEDKLNFILDILGENKEEWELVYSNS
jgi:hypothetical protein